MPSKRRRHEDWPDCIDFNRCKEALHEDRASASDDHRHEPTPRHLARCHEHPSDRLVDGGITTAGAGPVDDDGTAWTDHHVEWMKIEVEETVPVADRRLGQLVRGRQVVKVAMEIGETPS